MLSTKIWGKKREKKQKRSIINLLVNKINKYISTPENKPLILHTPKTCLFFLRRSKNVLLLRLYSAVSISWLITVSALYFHLMSLQLNWLLSLTVSSKKRLKIFVSPSLVTVAHFITIRLSLENTLMRFARPL